MGTEAFKIQIRCKRTKNGSYYIPHFVKSYYSCVWETHKLVQAYYIFVNPINWFKKRMIYESLLLLSWTLQRDLEQISVNKFAVLFTTFQHFECLAVEIVILIEIHTICNLMGGWKISLCVFCINFSWSCKPTVTCLVWTVHFVWAVVYTKLHYWNVQ